MSAAPVTTFIASGTLPSLIHLESPYLLSMGDWFLKIHSITFENLPPTDYLLELSVNLVQPNQNIAREVRSAQRSTGEQPLKVFHLLTKGSGSVKSRLSHVAFTDSQLYKVNRVKDKVEFTLSEVGREGRLPLSLAGTVAFIHASLYKN